MRFSNATEFNIFQEQHCSKCLNWRERGTGDYQHEGCPIIDNLVLHSDKMLNPTVIEVYAEFLYWGGDEERHCSMMLEREGDDA